MPFVNRFFLNDTGALTYTGNTLGLSRSNSVGVPGTVDSIGAYVTTNTALQLGTYPPGTTSDFHLNSSSAILQLPLGSSVIYAELIWGGTYINNGVDNSAFINDAVTFVTPLGSFSISPSMGTRFEVLLSSGTQYGNVYAYVRSAEVTTLVQAAGAGTYTAGGIVGTIVVPDPTSNNCGWTLAVAYHDPTQQLRNLSIRVGAEVILATSGPVTELITGFATPQMGTLGGRALIGAQEGDANKSGDQALFGPTTSSLTVLSGPNNYPGNFFASQINNDLGQLDTSGTFGTRNQINGQPGSNIIGGRQGWDITNIDVSSTLEYLQTSAYLQLTTNGDGYLVNTIGLQLNIQTPLLTITKSADQSNVTVGTIVTYTVIVKNEGAVDATSVVLTDSIEAEGTFVPNSVTVNGSTVLGVDPTTGIPLGTLTPGGQITITFQYQITAVPDDGFVKDQAVVAYDFQPNPQSPVISTSVPSNIVQVEVFQPSVSVMKSGTPSPVLVGGVATYMVVVSNAGDITVDSVILTDTIPAGTSFVPNSVTVDGSNVPGVDPVTGIPLGSLTEGASRQVTFQLLVLTDPPGHSITDIATASYTYSLEPGHPIPGQNMSNQVTLPVINPDINPHVIANKEADKQQVIVGETVMYTVQISNYSMEAILNTVVTDTISEDVSFVPNSVTINGVSAPGTSPETGITLGTLGPGISAIITFQYIVISMPNPPVITDTANVAFNYRTVPYNQSTNPVQVDVLQPVITLTKRCSVSEAEVGDNVTYSITVANTGNVAATVVLTDLGDINAVFVPGTVRVNGVLNPAVSPLTGIPVGDINADSEAVVSFDVHFVAPPASSGQFYIDQSTAAYSYQSPSGQTGSGISQSNKVEVRYINFAISVTKSVNPTMARVGQQVTFIIVVTNNGNTAIMNAVLTDFSDPGVQYVPVSAVSAGIPVSGNLEDGFQLGAIQPGQTVVVTYVATVVSIPANGAIRDTAWLSYTENGTPARAASNPAVIYVTEPVVEIVKEVRESYVFIGDWLHYRLIIRNIGSFNVLAFVSDIIPPGTEYVPNSLKINGYPIPGESLQNGILTGTVEREVTYELTFMLRVVFFPPGGIAVNQSKIAATFEIPGGGNYRETILSNPVQSLILTSPTVTKTADVTEVPVGGVFVYGVEIENPNLVPLDQAILYDPLPAGLSFVLNSVTVNGTSIIEASPLSGIPIGTIPPESTFNVRFVVQVNYEPNPPITVNAASINFQFLLLNGDRLPGIVNSNEVLVEITEEEE
ncbi:putative repeat protein (TIGR01451 family) [Paenibacillus cellulosilyticus]|uniref:Putative repeat protein (TIGR01451 family) n=1 Tax=Paenibacillus cellulosilyticus TaxID=375489 RepID=A0A2V2YSQ8_9BACL|nr:DUF11 domain-containing protein [Paenibacillus cellulosilyticus]PWW01262.1 putative repeat protein (TIGR01451 family) [Paenibacillus cellulosilyticus]QKS46791.1 DUF11 domain-containing protein [Paenibacillus cellulosilyticus]